MNHRDLSLFHVEQMETLDVSLPKSVVPPSRAGHDEDMNIQGPLLLLGVTATTTVGLGTVAVNSGAVNFEDVAGLLAGTSSAVSGATAGEGVALASPAAPGATSSLNPVAETSNPSLYAVTIDGIAATEHGASGASITSHADGSTNANSGSSAGTNHGSSSGSWYSAGGSTNASSGTSSGATHGSSGGSAAGYEDEEDDRDEDDYDEDEDHDEDEDEDEGEDD